jgi:hypothetical protein
VDETIIDSRALVERAYRDVGIKIPADAWGRRWQDWLVDLCGSYELALETHARKMDVYGALLMRTDLTQFELPAAHVVRRWIKAHGTDSVRYLTAGSATTAYGIIMRLGISSQLSGNLTYAERLGALHSAPPGTTYLDDNEVTLFKLKSDAPELNLIWINGQTRAELERQIGVPL